MPFKFNPITGNLDYYEAGGSGTPSGTVASETSFGISPNAGVASSYSRGDHTHGSTGHDDHTLLSNIGANTHSQIDTNLTRLANTSGNNTGDQDLSGLTAHTALTTTAHGGIVANTDSRLSDARTPTNHEASHKSGGADAFLSTDILEAIVKRLQETSGPTTMTMGSLSDGQYLKRSGTSLIGGNPAAGSFSATQTMVDFGTTPAESKEFVITDANCTVNSKPVVSMAYVDTTTNSADEIEMSKVGVSAGLPAAGSFTATVYAADGPIVGIFAINYALG